VTDQLYLIALNESTRESNANYVISREQWELILATARANGWNPMGTTLDFEFHCELEASSCGDLDQHKYYAIARMVLDKRRAWHGGYHVPEYQVVTDADAKGLRRALEGTDAASELLQFLSLGAFRIAG
jgi:hypothetical protein